MNKNVDLERLVEVVKLTTVITILSLVASLIALSIAALKWKRINHIKQIEKRYFSILEIKTNQ